MTQIELMIKLLFDRRLDQYAAAVRTVPEYQWFQGHTEMVQELGERLEKSIEESTGVRVVSTLEELLSEDVRDDDFVVLPSWIDLSSVLPPGSEGFTRDFDVHMWNDLLSQLSSRFRKDYGALHERNLRWLLAIYLLTTLEAPAEYQEDTNETTEAIDVNEEDVDFWKVDWESMSPQVNESIIRAKDRIYHLLQGAQADSRDAHLGVSLIGDESCWRVFVELPRIFNAPFDTAAESAVKLLRSASLYKRDKQDDMLFQWFCWYKRSIEDKALNKIRSEWNDYATREVDLSWKREVDYDNEIGRAVKQYAKTYSIAQ